MGLVFCVCLVVPKVFKRPKKHLGKPNIQKKAKENQKRLRGYQQNKVFKSFRPTLGYGFVLFSPRRFLDNQTNIRENQKYKIIPKKTKDNQRKPKKPSGKPKKQKKKLNPYPRVGMKLLKTLFCWFSLMFCFVCFVFFGFLLYLWFSLRIFWFCKNLREIQKKQKKHPRVCMKPLKTLLFGFPDCFLLVFFGFL